MDEFEKIKTFSESLVERQQKMAETASNSTDKAEPELNLPQYLSQFRAIPIQEEKESKRLLWIVLFLCIVVAGGTIYALTKRLPEMEEAEIVVISPTPTPVKVLPENPGGLNIPDKDKVVYNRMAESTPAPVVESLFPEPEQPMMPNEVIEPEIKEDVVLKAEQPLVEEVPMPDEEVLPPIEDQIVVETEIPVIEEQTEIAEEVATTPIVTEGIPAVPQIKPAEVQDKKTEVVIDKPKTTRPIWRAQLLSSASKAKVESSWKTIAKEQAALLSDMPYQIVSATIPGKGTFWRLQVGEFSTKEMVVNLCAKLKKKKQECIPVK